MDATERLLGLIDITEQLAALLMKENKALKDQQADEATKLLTEKNNLSRIYETRVRGLMDDQEALSKTDAGLRQKLREIGEKVNAMIIENAYLLKVAIDTNRRIVDMVADAVKTQKPGPGTYSANGTSGNDEVHSAPRNMAISLDQSL
ncbi:MAG: hypothetical protein HQ504_07990 [Rhodospirillaceae bacterium]|nr:hypothetical protein [Rhodospirillaceae bacterium]